MARARSRKRQGFKKFENFAKRLVAVPKAELQEQIRLHDEQSRKSESRPGPKPRKKVAARKKRV